MARLTHLDAANLPTMVDVGAKTATFREASAEATVKLPPSVARELKRTIGNERPVQWDGRERCLVDQGSVGSLAGSARPVHQFDVLALSAP